jgi:hypothetical protein
VVKRLPFSGCVQMFFKVFNGYRPPIPQGMPKGLADLMTAAWSHTPEERPSYRFIVKALQRLIREVCLEIAPICLLLPLFMCCRRRVCTWHPVVHPPTLYGSYRHPDIMLQRHALFALHVSRELVHAFCPRSSCFLLRSTARKSLGIAVLRFLL